MFVANWDVVQLTVANREPLLLYGRPLFFRSLCFSFSGCESGRCVAPYKPSETDRSCPWGLLAGPAKPEPNNPVGPNILKLFLRWVLIFLDLSAMVVMNVVTVPN